MRIDHVGQAYRAELSKKIDARQKKAGPAKAKKLDRADLSQDGKLLNETQASMESTKPHVTNASEVRADRVEEVKNRIKSGYYDSPEFAGRLADKLIQDIGKELGIS